MVLLSEDMTTKVLLHMLLFSVERKTRRRKNMRPLRVETTTSPTELAHIFQEGSTASYLLITVVSWVESKILYLGNTVLFWEEEAINPLESYPLY